MESPFTDLIDAYDLTVDQRKVLGMISDEGSRVPNIFYGAKRMGISRPRIIEIIKGLVDLGFIEKGRDKDRRITYKAIK